MNRWNAFEKAYSFKSILLFKKVSFTLAGVITMRRPIFLLFLMTCSTAWAEWEQTNHAGDETSTFYHDKSTIKGTGSIVKMLTMINYSVEKNLKSGGRYESVKRLDGYDCRSETTAPITVSYFSGSMSSGSIVFSYTVKNSELEWEPIIPSSLGEKHWKIACGKN
jgi:hypothetical protein